MTLAILKTLIIISDRLPPSVPSEWAQDKQLANLLYSKEHIHCLGRIIGHSAPSLTIQQSVFLAINLICKTCSEEREKKALVEAGVLDILATKLATFIVAQGFVLPGAVVPQESGVVAALPAPAPTRARLGPNLQAIALLVEQSKPHAEQFLCSPAILAVFPKAQTQFSPNDVRKTPWGTSTYLSGAAVPKHATSNPIDNFLPVVPITSAKLSADQSNFPPLGSIPSVSKKQSAFLSTSFGVGESASRSNTNEEEESPMIAWLILTVRAESGMTRLMAAKLLIALFRLGLARRGRAAMFCMLLVPLLVKMLDKDDDSTELDEHSSGDVLSMNLRIREQTPGVLASLVMDSPKLQKAAVEANAIKKLSQHLKETFDPLPGHKLGLWFPEKTLGSPRNLKEPEKILGEEAPTPMARHFMRYREGLLQALAAIAPFDDDYRKAICDQGVVPYIIDSLRPYNAAPQVRDRGDKMPSMIPGNPGPTLLAACGIARALTRSVSVLRTNLIDAGVAQPLFGLLKNQDTEVQIAASAVVINLAMSFSPMKEAIINQGVVKTLCQHAHSANPRLRLNAIWALKHLVYDTTNDLRINTIQELGANWIKHIISIDPADISEGTIIGMGATSYIGQAVDLSKSETRDGLDDAIMAEGTTPGQERWRRSTAKRRAQALAEETDPHRHTIKDDTAIQEHLLDLIRNILCGEGAAEMIDYIFKEMGQKDFFDIIADRIKPRVTGSTNRKDSKSTAAPTEVIIAALYIVVHISANASKYRSIVAAQSNLLRQVLALFNHSSRQIRVNCCWIAINLTYEDDPSDRAACRQRARELEKLGYVPRLMALQDDVDLDVRERMKTAVSLLSTLLN